MRNLVLATVWMFAAVGVATAFADVVEVESNDTFGTRQMLPGGTRVVTGAISLTHDFTESGTLTVGGVNPHTFSADAGQWFAAWVDNGDGLPPWVVDPDLGSFNAAGGRVGYDDYSSPVGNGIAPALMGNANPDGSISLKVTGNPDEFFTGNHAQSGDYDLYVKLDGSDVDFFTFSGLTPGTIFSAETTAGDFDTMLGLFDDDGSLLYFEDSGGIGLLSKLEGLVPASGKLNIAVTGWNDQQFSGFHLLSGDYTLTLTAVPEPATLVLWLLTGVIGVCWWSRKRRAVA